MKTLNVISRNFGRPAVGMALLLMTAASGYADYQSVVLGDNPVGYWPVSLDDANATNGIATDLSGNGNHGAYVNISPGFNNVSGPTAYLTNGTSFNGSFTYVDLSGVPNASLLNFGGTITMEGWVQANNPGQSFGAIIAKGYDPANDNAEVYLWLNSHQYQGGTYTGTTSIRGAYGGTVTTNWTYVVTTYDGTNWNTYVNARLVAQGADTVGALNLTAPWAIGDGTLSGNLSILNGNLSQVALYTHALTPAQVMNHYTEAEVNLPATAAKPIIETQPQSQASYVGGTVTFSVVAVSGFGMTNQWFKGISPISGQTNSTLLLANLALSDAANYSVVVGNVNGTTNSAVAVLTVSTPRNLEWSANGNSGNWDNSSANWINLTNSQQTVFSSGDAALFDDTAGAPTSVTVSSTVSPSLTTVNSTNNNFFITGGAISGSGSLVKKGSSTLEIAGANDFSGQVTISGGTVKMDEPLSGSATSLGSGSGAAIVVTNGATLAVNASGGYPAGNSGISTRAITISGSGVGGLGALQSVGNDIYHDGAPNGGLFRSLTLAGDATIGGSGRWDLGQEGILTFVSTGGSNFNLTCLQGGYSEWHSVTIDTNLGNIDYILGSGNYWVLNGMGNSLGNPTNTITLHGNVTMQLQGNGNGQDNGYAKIIHVTSGSSFGYRPYNGTGDYHLDTSLILDDGISWYFFNVNGGSEKGVNLGGKVSLNGMTHLQIGDGNVTLTDVISGSGGFVWDNYNHLLVFTAANTYSGSTVIGDGRTLALSGNGSIAQSALIFFGGNNPGSTHVDASSRSDSTLSLASGQTLGGIGAVTGNLVESGGAAIAPAGTNTTISITTGANQTGAITVTGNITLHGTTMLKLNGSGTSDSVQAGGNVSYGGTLSLANISGVPLAAGNSFQIFSAVSYSGSFASITPATPGAGLAWDTTQLNTGLIKVALASRPVISSTRVSGGSLIFSGTGGTALGSFSVLTTTNVATALTNWTVLATGNFDGTGTFSVTNAIGAGTPKRFFLLKTP